MAVVVVESPAKAKTINKYLGAGYTVLASYGHVRDLPAKDGSVRPDAGFEMDWEIDAKAQKHVRAIAEALKGEDRLILATDPDREGEAISWHLLEALRRRRALKKDTPVERVVFNAITKAAVSEAMAKPRDIDTALVEAYLARRALDYLVGFNLSPVLWRKLPGAKSAGRVQSVALRLVVEREMEIEAHVAREYWQVRAHLAAAGGDGFEARLTTLDGRKLDRFDLADLDTASAAVAAVADADLSVASVEAKPTTRNPAPPFMTSTLQQEASRKLGWGTQAAMRTAQKLYEAGHITYMRTDGLDMAPEAVQAARRTIERRYGADYLPEKPRVYKTKAKNAQEAHECIRPTDMGLSPKDLRAESDERRLYELIWQRAVASQMASAKMMRTTVEIADAKGRAGLRATGQVVTFEGFLAVYEEGRDDKADDDEGRRLPPLEKGQTLALAGGLDDDFRKIVANDAEERPVTSEGAQKRHPAAVLDPAGVIATQSFTQPPARYTEATLVKRMEELGIGRPSTYASILATLQDRTYVRKDRNRLYAEDSGRLVTAFLMNYFPRYVEYDFTAGLEEELDDVSGGRIDWKDVLDRFWRDFTAALEETSDLRISEVLETINEALGPHLFPDRGDGTDPRLCPHCGKGRLSIKTSSKTKSAFIGCENYPECRYTRPFGVPGDDAELGAPEGKLLGHHPDDGEPISLRSGRYGPYVQKGEQAEGGPKPRRSSVSKGKPVDDVTLADALDWLSLPREVGRHPDDGEPIEAGIGRFGPYVRHLKTFANLPKGEDPRTVGMNRAVDLIAQKRERGNQRAAAQKPLRELGEHPDGGAVAILDGRYGPYVNWGKVNVTLSDTPVEDVTLDQALEWIAEKAPAKKGAKKTKAADGDGAGKGATKAKAAGANGKAKAAAAKTKAGNGAASGKAAGASKTGAKSNGAASKPGGARSRAKSETTGR
ncbi:MAG: type I DNA topoisomerase [Paracoccaceae bacterium]